MVRINGEEKPWQGKSLEEVLQALGVDPRRVAVLLNERAYPGTRLPPRPLEAGDVVEVVALMQGG